MDEQHKKLIDLINQVYRSLRNNHGREEVNNVLENVLAYAKIHLKDEEALLEKAKYPGFNPHKKIHDKILAKANALKKEFDDGKSTVALDILMFLENWLIEHILKEDKKYAAFINQQH